MFPKSFRDFFSRIFEQKTSESIKHEPIFRLPPYQVKRVFKASSETIDWGLKLFSIPELWRVSAGEKIRIAVLDTGIDLRHPDLRESIVEAVDFTQSRTGVADLSGHGTHVAGIIAARRNQFGVVGVAPKAELLIAKVLGDNGTGSPEAIASAIDWAVRQRADLISMSLGAPLALDLVHRAIKNAIQQGKFIICAAGNNGPELGTVNYPAAYPETIAVGSIDRQKRISEFSSRGRQVDIVAPGDQILSTYPPSAYAELSGTSMATPFVTGVAALALAKHRLRRNQQTPIKNQQDLLDHLIATSSDLGKAGHDSDYGFGLINPKELLNYSNISDKIGDKHTLDLLDLAATKDLSSSGVHKLRLFLKKQQKVSSPLSARLKDKNQINLGEIKISF